jgi:hypothetical protein
MTDEEWIALAERYEKALAEVGLWARRCGEQEAHEARIAKLEAALNDFVRDQQSEAQAGTGEYQRGYDDCIADHADRARAALDELAKAQEPLGAEFEDALWANKEGLYEP